MDLPHSSCNEFDHVIPRAVADSKPYNFWWPTIKKAALLEVLILRNDCKSIDACVSPKVIISLA